MISHLQVQPMVIPKCTITVTQAKLEITEWAKLRTSRVIRESDSNNISGLYNTNMPNNTILFFLFFFCFPSVLIEVSNHTKTLVSTVEQTRRGNWMRARALSYSSPRPVSLI